MLSNLRYSKVRLKLRVSYLFGKSLVPFQNFMVTYNPKTRINTGFFDTRNQGGKTKWEK